MGKVICVIYSIVGIPLCLVAFQTVGNKINNMLTSWFSRSSLTRGVVIPQICLVFLVFLYSFSGAAIFASFESKLVVFNKDTSKGHFESSSL